MDPTHVFNHNLCKLAIMSPDVTNAVFTHNLKLISMSPDKRYQILLTLIGENITGSMAELITDMPVATFGDIDLMWNFKKEFGFFENVNRSLIEKYNFCFNPRTCILTIVPDVKYPGYGNVVPTCIIIFGIQNILPDVPTRELFPPPQLHRKRSRKTYPDLPVPDTHDFMLHRKIDKRGPAQKVSFDSKHLELQSRSSGRILRFWNHTIHIQQRIHCGYGSINSVSHLATNGIRMENTLSKHGWPDERTISLVVEGGCHVVPVAHNDCTDDEFQWRISFSRAEVTLMRTLTPGQQYIYNMLRWFVKTELIPVEWSSSDRVVLCTWWKRWCCGSANKSRQHFGEWRTRLNCVAAFWRLWQFRWWIWIWKTYFMSDCNLLSHKIHRENCNFVIEKLLSYANADTLEEWFVQKRAAQLARNILASTNKLSFAHCMSAYPWRNLNEDSIRFHVTVRYMECLFLHKRMVQPGEGTALDDGSTGFCAKDIGCINVFFVEYYKGFIMLQTVLLNRAYKKCDSLLAMLCTLYFNQSVFIEISPSSCHSSIFQLMACRFYYAVAKKVLSGHVTRTGTDYVVMVKLAKMLIKKELTLSGVYRVYQKESDKSGLYLHLASIYFASGRYDKFLKFIKTPLETTTFSKSNELTWISGNCLLYINDVAVAVGLQCLIACGSTAHTRSCFQISLPFLRKYLLFSYQMKQSIPLLSNSITEYEPKTVTDFVIARCMQQRANRSSLSSVTEPPGDLKMSWFARTENNDFGIKISVDNKFSDLIFKCAIIHMTSFFRQFKESEFVKTHRFMQTCWHYLALYWYSQKKYDVVLELCGTIIKEEEMSRPIILHPHMLYLPSCFFPFQDLFDSDVNCLMGLMFAVDKCALLCIRNRHTMSNVEEDLNIDELCIHIRPRFIAQYLTIRCLLELGSSYEDLASALGRISSELFMEHLLHQFIVFKVSKQRRNLSKVKFENCFLVSTVNATNIYRYSKSNFQLCENGFENYHFHE